MTLPLGARILAIVPVLSAAKGASQLEAIGTDVIVYPPAPTGSLVRLSDGRYVTGPAALLGDRDALITWFASERDLDALFTDDFVTALRPGTLVIDHTMASAAGARVLAQRIERAQARFVDAPILWGAGDAEGKLFLMVGAADAATFEAARAVVAPYVAEAAHVGAVGAGRICRMANQLSIAGALGGLAEALGLAMAAGLDPNVVVSVLGKGGAQSLQLQTRSQRMIDRDFAPVFPARQMQSDIGHAIDEAHALDLGMPLSATLREQYGTLIERGLGDEDCGNLLRLVLG